MNRPAFTLLELLIVLGLVAILLGMGMPSVYRMYVRSQFQGTVRELQATLYQTRLEAMKSGKAFVFRYKYKSSVYEILTKDEFDQREKAEQGFGAVAVGPELLRVDNETENDKRPESSMIYVPYRRRLPYQIVFGTPVKPVLPESMPIQIPMSDFEDGSNDTPIPKFQADWADERDIEATTGSTDGKWSSPILFYPNGRTSQATLILQMTGRYNFEQELTLRGLTGTARISE